VLRVDAAGADEVVEHHAVVAGEVGEHAAPRRLVRAEPVGQHHHAVAAAHDPHVEDLQQLGAARCAAAARRRAAPDHRRGVGAAAGGAGWVRGPKHGWEERTTGEAEPSGSRLYSSSWSRGHGGIVCAVQGVGVGWPASLRSPALPLSEAKLCLLPFDLPPALPPCAACPPCFIPPSLSLLLLVLGKVWCCRLDDDEFSVVPARNTSLRLDAQLSRPPQQQQTVVKGRRNNNFVIFPLSKSWFCTLPWLTLPSQTAQ
jgi:hypothetical protein